MKILKIIGWLSLLIALIGVICLASVSAMNLDNRKGELIKGEGISSYGKIEIKNFFGLGSTIATLELKKNSDYCLEDCSAEKEIVLTDEGILIDSVKFETITKDNKRIVQPIRSYQFYIKTGDKETEVDDYKETCKEKLSLNGTMETLCTTAKSGTHTELEPIWTKYELGQVVPAGTYNVKLEGQKSPSKTVDWIVQSQGVWIDDWVVWYSTLGTGLVSYWNFDDSLRDSVGGFDFTNFGGEFIAGKNNNQLNFTTPDYAILTQNYSVGGNMNRTYNFWGKMPLQNCNANGYESICYFIASGDGIAKDWNIGIYHRFWYFEGGGAGMGGQSLILNDNLTHMHTVTYNGTGITWYLDNAIILALKINQPNTVVKNISLAYDFLGGTGYYGNVTIDELGIWNRTLTVAEISDLYNSGAGRFYESIILNTPANAYTSIYPSVSFNCTSFMMEGLTNMSFWLDGIKNETLVKTGTINESIFNKLIANGNHNWTCSSCDTDNVCIFAANRTLTITGFIENSQTFTNITTSGARENFLINVTYDSSYYTSVNPIFRYNSTIYSVTQIGTGNDKIFNASITVPQVTAPIIKSFNWTFVLTNSSGSLFYINSTSNTQTINPLQADNCTSLTRRILNFSLRDEDTRLNINGTVEVLVNFWDSTRTILTGTYNNTYSTLGAISVCINITNNATFSTDYIAKYYSNLTGVPDYSTEYKFVDNLLIDKNTATQVVNLYDLLYARSTEFEITLQNPDLSVVQGAIIDIQRRYIPINQFLSVESPKTDNKGKTVAHLVAETEYYNFVITKDGIVIATFNNNLAKCQTPSTGDCRILLNLAASVPALPNYVNYGNVSISYLWNKAAREVSLNFISIDSQNHNVTWKVLKHDSWGNTTICSDGVTALSGTLLCTVPALYGNSSIYAMTWSDGKFLGYNYFSLYESASNIFGGTAIIFGLLMYSMITFLMIGNPVAMVIGSILGIIFAAAFHFVDGGSFIGNTSIIIWFVVAGGVVIYALRNKT